MINIKKQQRITKTAIILLSNISVLLVGFNLNAQQLNQTDSIIKFDDTRKSIWPKEFSLVEIQSSIDNNIQRAYFYKSESREKKPLIVSLHTWSGDYAQRDSIAELCRVNDINYIHPDFRGPNHSKQACCSDLVISDISDAIDYAIMHANVDTTRISIIGVSGGGYATLCCFMKLKRRIHQFAAWAAITDLIAWHNESEIRGNKYAQDILDCTCSSNQLDEINAKQRSPFYFDTPLSKLEETKLSIYAGIYDGIQGSVPITHSINFYNKLLEDLSEKNPDNYISDSEKLKLLELRKPLGKFGSIGGRKIFLQKKIGNITMTIFEGGHEMLTKYTFEEVCKD